MFNTWKKQASRNGSVNPTLVTKNTNTVLEKTLAMSVPRHKMEVVPYFFLILQNSNCMTYLPDRDKQRREMFSLCILIGFMCKFCGHTMFTEPEAELQSTGRTSYIGA